MDFDTKLSFLTSLLATSLLATSIATTDLACITRSLAQTKKDNNLV